MHGITLCSVEDKKIVSVFEVCCKNKNIDIYYMILAITIHITRGCTVLSEASLSWFCAHEHEIVIPGWSFFLLFCQGSNFVVDAPSWNSNDMFNAIWNTMSLDCIDNSKNAKRRKTTLF